MGRACVIGRRQFWRATRACTTSARIWSVRPRTISKGHRGSLEPRAGPAELSAAISRRPTDRPDSARNRRPAFGPPPALCRRGKSLPRSLSAAITGEDRDRFLPSIASSEGRPSCDSGSRSGAIRSLRQDTLSHYLDAIEVIVRNGLYSIDELRELEMQVIRMSYSSPYYDFGDTKLSASRPLWRQEFGALAHSHHDARRVTDWHLLGLTGVGVPEQQAPATRCSNRTSKPMTCSSKKASRKHRSTSCCAPEYSRCAPDFPPQPVRFARHVGIGALRRCRL